MLNKHVFNTCKQVSNLMIQHQHPLHQFEPKTLFYGFFSIFRLNCNKKRISNEISKWPKNGHGILTIMQSIQGTLNPNHTKLTRSQHNSYELIWAKPTPNPPEGWSRGKTNHSILNSSAKHETRLTSYQCPVSLSSLTTLKRELDLQQTTK